MTKAQLKKLYLNYLAEPKMPNGESWDRCIPLFCEPNLNDDERQELWQRHVTKTKNNKLVSSNTKVA